MQDHLRLDPIFPFSCRKIEGKTLFLLGGKWWGGSSGPKILPSENSSDDVDEKKRGLLVSESRGLMWDCDACLRGRRGTEEKRQKRRENEGMEMRVFILYLGSAHWSVFVSVIPLMYR